MVNAGMIFKLNSQTDCRHYGCIAEPGQLRRFRGRDQKYGFCFFWNIVEFTVVLWRGNDANVFR
jgi:hypothetical protein